MASSRGQTKKMKNGKREKCDQYIGGFNITIGESTEKISALDEKSI